MEPIEWIVLFGIAIGSYLAGRSRRPEEWLRRRRSEQEQRNLQRTADETEEPE